MLAVKHNMSNMSHSRAKLLKFFFVISEHLHKNIEKHLNHWAAAIGRRIGIAEQVLRQLILGSGVVDSMVTPDKMPRNYWKNGKYTVCSEIDLELEKRY